MKNTTRQQVRKAIAELLKEKKQYRYAKPYQAGFKVKENASGAYKKLTWALTELKKKFPDVSEGELSHELSVAVNSA